MVWFGLVWFGFNRSFPGLHSVGMYYVESYECSDISWKGNVVLEEEVCRLILVLAQARCYDVFLVYGARIKVCKPFS